MKTVGFIGLGRMGLPMAKRLILAGYDLIGFDLDPSAVKSFTELGIQDGGSPKGVSSRCDILITMLPQPFVTKSVMLDKDGAAEGLKTGSVYVDMSTSDPSLTRQLCKHLKDKGVAMLDAPVSGGTRGAVEGSLSIMVGGDEDTFRLLKPLFFYLGKEIFHVGDIGAGHTIKILNNLLFTIIMTGTAEVMTLGQKAGLDLKMMREVMNKSSARSYAMDVKVRDFIIPQNFKPGFSVDLQNKDTDLALKLAKDLDIPVMLGSFARQIYHKLTLLGFGNMDTSIVIKFFEDLMKSEKIEGGEDEDSQLGKG